MQRWHDVLLVKTLRLFPKDSKFSTYLFAYKPLARLISKSLINYRCYSITPRPRKLSLAADYPTWTSLTDKRFSGRHLDPDPIPDLPDVKVVSALWARQSGQKEIPSQNSSLLFGFFAQWLTDSFLRTDPDCFRRNVSNHQLDLGQIYGANAETTARLRANEDGLLRSQKLPGHEKEYPQYLFDPKKIENDEEGFEASPLKYLHKDFAELHDSARLNRAIENVPRDKLRYFFATGLEHGNSSVGQQLFNTIWLREHNQIARMLKEKENLRDDDEIFEKARNTNILIYLRVIIRDYIRHISGRNFSIEIMPGFPEKQAWYRENWIAVEFNLLYRWHSLVSDHFTVNEKPIEMTQFIQSTNRCREFGIEALLTAASQQRGGKIGLCNTPNMFTTPSTADKGAGLSVIEKSVKLGRDARVGRYNDYRKAFSLKPLKNFNELTNDVALAKQLKQLYGTIDRLEWHVGVFAESPNGSGLFGDLMYAMVAYDALTHALTNPLLCKTVYFSDDTFTRTGRKIAEDTDSIQQIVDRNSDENKSALASFAYP